jgi:septal ring factor EnvC (AmiA/AmiB activator)
MLRADGNRGDGIMETWIEIISTLGFPIACVVAMAAFIFCIYKQTTKEYAENMEKVQARGKEREDKLYNELALCREVNSKAIETIAHYAEKLDVIQKDISDIKTDITIIMSQD